MHMYKVYKKKSKYPADILKNISDEETFNKSRLYAIDKAHFSFFCDIYDLIFDSSILYFRLIGWAYYFSKDVTSNIRSTLITHTGYSLGFDPSSEISVSLVMITLYSIFSFFERLPRSLYHNFVIEERYGFNNQTLGFFLKDKVKSVILSLVISLPITAALTRIIQVGGDYFYVIAYLFLLAVTLIMMFIYPEFIAPLFDRYELLPESPLREKIYALANKVSFPLKKLFVVEGSKRSAHSNAYFYGFGSNKRIVLFDTLIHGFVFPGKTQEDAVKKGCSESEIEAVLCHEFGHWKYGHLLYHLGIAQANLFFLFLIFSSFINADSLFMPFGFLEGETPIFIKLMIILQFLFLPYNTLYGYLSTYLTRVFEFQADRFSVGLGFAAQLKTAL
ncbi:CAAX prenyl protease 1, partial [Cichlidogyrus casuarinus]